MITVTVVKCRRKRGEKEKKNALTNMGCGYYMLTGTGCHIDKHQRRSAELVMGAETQRVVENRSRCWRRQARNWNH